MTSKEFRALVQSHLEEYDLKYTRLRLALPHVRATLQHTKTIDKAKVVEAWYHAPAEGDSDTDLACRVADALAHVYHRWDHETPHMVRHSLHHNCFFKVHVLEEKRCRWCVHSQVCSHDMSKVCKNYDWGTSAVPASHCNACIHHYTRYHEDGIPCFDCAYFQKRRTILNDMSDPDHYEVWVNPHSDKSEGHWRVGVCRVRERSRVRKFILSEKTGNDFFGGPDAAVEFVPLTDVEYERWVKHISDNPSRSFVNFTEVLKRARKKRKHGKGKKSS